MLMLAVALAVVLILGWIVYREDHARIVFREIREDGKMGQRITSKTIDTDTPRSVRFLGESLAGKPAAIENVTVKSDNPDAVDAQLDPSKPGVLILTGKIADTSTTVRVFADGHIGDGVKNIEGALSVFVQPPDAAGVVFEDEDAPTDTGAGQAGSQTGDQSTQQQ